MKKAGVFLAFFGLVFGLVAADAKQITVKVGSLSIEDTPFKVERISITNKDLLKVEVISENGRQLRFSGLKADITDVQVLGGKMSQQYKVQIVDDLRTVYIALKRDLDAVPEIDISINNNRLVLKGELSSIANQVLKNKVTRAYGSVILDLTTFRPTPEVMIGLQKNLEKAGFKVVRNAQNAAPGEISITQVGEMLTISGSVYSQEDLKMIGSILSAQPWLSVNDANSAAAQNKVQAYVNVQVLPVMLQLDIIHIALNKTEQRKFGIDFGQFFEDGIGAFFNGAYNVLDLRNSPLTQNPVGNPTGWSAGAYGNILGVLRVFGNSGFTRVRRAGTLTFLSNDAKSWRELHDGGKVWISSGAKSNMGNNSTVVTTTQNLTEVDTGLMLRVRGGLNGKDTITLEINQELSLPVAPRFGEDYQVNTTSYKTSIRCKLGQTVAIGGLSKFLQTNTNTSSIPYLRNVPGLKWLISQEGNEFNTDEILTLVCVRKMVPAGKTDPVAVELEKFKKAEDKDMAERKAAEVKNAGKWYEFWRW